MSCGCVVYACQHGRMNRKQALLDAIASSVHDKYNSKQDVLHTHMLIHAYVTVDVNATFIRPRQHYIAVARAAVNFVIKCDGVRANSKIRFLKKMETIKRVFQLMYRSHEFSMSYAAKSDAYTFIDRAKWTQVISNQRKIVLRRCLLLTNYKPENTFLACERDPLFHRLTTMLPYDVWSLIYQYV